MGWTKRGIEGGEKKYAKDCCARSEGFELLEVASLPELSSQRSSRQPNNLIVLSSKDG